jgi:hypothetical protein
MPNFGHARPARRRFWPRIRHGEFLTKTEPYGCPVSRFRRKPLISGRKRITVLTVDSSAVNEAALGPPENPMQLAALVLAYLFGVSSTSLATTCWLRRRQRQHDFLVAVLRDRIRLQELGALPPPPSGPHRIPPPFPGPVVPPPYW